MEVFKDIKGYEEHYKISNLGNVKSIKFGKISILKTAKNNGGYLYSTPCKNGFAKKITIHRLIATHFIPNPENKPCINHKNGIKTDNRIENLEWVTYLENYIHAKKNGLIGKPKWTGKFGYEHNRSKEVHQYCNKTLRYLMSFGSCHEVARKMNCTHAKILLAVRRKTKTRDGYLYSINKSNYFHYD